MANILSSFFFSPLDRGLGLVTSLIFSTDCQEMAAIATKTRQSDSFIPFHRLGPLTAPMIRNKL